MGASIAARQVLAHVDEEASGGDAQYRFHCITFGETTRLNLRRSLVSRQSQLISPKSRQVVMTGCPAACVGATVLECLTATHATDARADVVGEMTRPAASKTDHSSAIRLSRFKSVDPLPQPMLVSATVSI